MTPFGDTQILREVRIHNKSENVPNNLIDYGNSWRAAVVEETCPYIGSLLRLCSQDGGLGAR
jgi:hypothetical protein